jgi:hypothetical protein
MQFAVCFAFLRGAGCSACARTTTTPPRGRLPTCSTVAM